MVCLVAALTVPALSLSQTAPTRSEPDPSVVAQGARATSALDDSALTRSAPASRLIGSRVYANDAVVGEIEDLLIDGERSAVTAAVVSPRLSRPRREADHDTGSNPDLIELV
jgi:hypothetical protein